MYTPKGEKKKKKTNRRTGGKEADFKAQSTLKKTVNGKIPAFVPQQLTPEQTQREGKYPPPLLRALPNPIDENTNLPKRTHTSKKDKSNLECSFSP